MSIFSAMFKDVLGQKTGETSAHLLDRYAKLHRFIEKRIQEDLYAESPDAVHVGVTHDVLKRIDDRWGLRGKQVLDAGCGQGLALEKLIEYGAVAKGLTFGKDFEVCKSKGLDVYEMDMSFLEFPDESFDLVWARHSMEHSLFPYFTLDVFFSVLKKGGMLYVEVPAPDTSASHQRNINHYSCLTRSSWMSLFERTGFKELESFDIDVKLECGPDVWFTFYLQKP